MVVQYYIYLSAIFRPTLKNQNIKFYDVKTVNTIFKHVHINILLKHTLVKIEIILKYYKKSVTL